MKPRIHAIPVGANEPLHHAHIECWCHPLLEPEPNGEIVMHNAKDCRERFERQGLEHPDRAWSLVCEGPADPDSDPLGG